MKCLFAIAVAILLMFPNFSHASEESDPFAFGAATLEEVDDGSYEEGPDVPYVDQDYFSFGDVDSNSQEVNVDSVPENIPEMNMDSSQIPSPLKSPTASIPGVADFNQEAASIPMVPITKDQTLTGIFKQDEAVKNIKDAIPLPKVEGTWVGKLTESNPLKTLSDVTSGKKSIKSSDTPNLSGETLEKMVEKSKLSKGRSNASVFDISGVMLRMSLKQVDDIMQNRGFRKTMQKYQIPNFIKWRNEETCRNSGVVGYERLDSCVVEQAKKEKHQYVQVAKYIKYDTQEDVEVSLTSNFTENKVYKIVYTSMSPNVTGNSAKATYLRNIKIYDFWKKINQKYGNPDNKNDVTWGLGGNKPYLKAKTGYLLLEDPMFRELDYTRMSREDQRYMNTDMYSF